MQTTISEMIQTQCPECQRINPVKAQDPRTIRPELQCAACVACNRVYNVQAHLAPTPAPEAPACGHPTTRHFCLCYCEMCKASAAESARIADKRHAAREAAQRADEAELLAMVNVPGGHDHICSECGEEFLCPAPDSCDHDEYQRCPDCTPPRIPMARHTHYCPTGTHTWKHQGSCPVSHTLVCVSHPPIDHTAPAHADEAECHCATCDAYGYHAPDHHPTLAAR